MSIGQKMTFYAQVQRGGWVPNDGFTGGGSSGDGGVNFYACVRLSIFGLSAT